MYRMMYWIKLIGCYLSFCEKNGPSRVKRKTIINNLESGGLKMPDIYAFHTAQKCLWIKRLLDDNKKIGRL